MVKKLVFCAILLILLFGLTVPVYAQGNADNQEKGPPAKEVVILVHYPKSHIPDIELPGRENKPNKPNKPDKSDPYKTLGWWRNNNLHVYANLTNAIGDHDSFLSGVTDGLEAWDTVSGLTLSLSENSEQENSLYNGLSDGVNVISWEQLASKFRNAIAVCVVYRYVNTKEIIEADIAMATEYDWIQNTILGDPNAEKGQEGYMDVQNIATHEFGHFVGLDDLRGASEQTMYAYSDYAEVKKRSLESGDIAGVQKIYGP